MISGFLLRFIFYFLFFPKTISEAASEHIIVLTLRHTNLLKELDGQVWLVGDLKVKQEDTHLLVIFQFQMEN